MNKKIFLITFGFLLLVINLFFVSALEIQEMPMKIVGGNNNGKLVSQAPAVSLNKKEAVDASFKIVNDESKKSIKVVRWILPEEEVVSHEGVLKYWREEHYSKPYIEFTSVLDKGKEVVFNVQIKYKKIPYGQLSSVIEVRNANTNELLSLRRGQKILLKCDGNKVCDQTIGENYKTCPGDCKSGLKDSYCDKVKDRKCDPDCVEGLDTDCGKGKGKKIVSPPEWKRQDVASDENSQTTSVEEMKTYTNKLLADVKKKNDEKINQINSELKVLTEKENKNSKLTGKAVDEEVNNKGNSKLIDRIISLIRKAFS